MLDLAVRQRPGMYRQETDGGQAGGVERAPSISHWAPSCQGPEAGVERGGVESLRDGEPTHPPPPPCG